MKNSPFLSPVFRAAVFALTTILCAWNPSSHAQTIDQTTNSQQAVVQAAASAAAAERAALDARQAAATNALSITADGAAGSFGPHAARFVTDLSSSSSAVQFQMFDGSQLDSQISGIFLYDPSSSNGVQIASLQSTTGMLLPPSQVIYSNAFTGIKADVLYTVTPNSLEQNIVLRRQLPTPDQYGLNPGVTMISVITEFQNPPTARLTPSTVDLSPWAGPNSSVSNLVDETIFFPTMQIGPGRAFVLDNTNISIPVVKSWISVSGKTYLVESIPYAVLASQLSALPPDTAQFIPKPAQPLKSLLAQLQSAGQKRASLSLKGAKMALAGPETLRGPGVVLDYFLTDTATMNFLFAVASSAKIGFGAVGQTANDYWNGYVFPYVNIGVVTNLLWSNTNSSGAGLTVLNAPGEGGNGISDGLGSYIYRYGGPITATITNLASGTYDFFIYGHSPSDNAGSVFTLNNSNGPVSYPVKGTTIWGPGWNTTNWEESQYYVVYRSVSVSSNSPVTLTVEVDLPNYAILNGMQIVPTGSYTNTPYISSLFDLNFGAFTSNRTGFAAVGLTNTDLWNGLYGLNANQYGLANLQWSDGYTSAFGLTVSNAAGISANGVSDTMYGTNVFATNTGISTITITNMANGNYDFYVYGHGATNGFNGIYKLVSGTNTYGPNGTTIWDNPWNGTNWEEGQQYTVFRSVIVVTNQPVYLYSQTNGYSKEIISGVQVALGTPLPSTFSTYDGVPDWWLLQYGLNPHLTVDQFGVSMYVDYIEGRNPTVGTTNDSGNVIQLNVYTPFH